MSSLLVCGNVCCVDVKNDTSVIGQLRKRCNDCNPTTATTMEQTMIEVTQEVVRGLVGLDPPGGRRRFEGAYQIAVTVSRQYQALLDQQVGLLAITDMDTAVQSFTAVLDAMFGCGPVNCGRVAVVVVFAGRVVQHCMTRRIITVDDVDRLSEAMGRHLATRLISSQQSVVSI